MIVQPASLGPRSRPRRALRILALVLPVVLLGGVIAIGVLGPAPAPDAPPSASPPAVAIADPTPSPTPLPAVEEPAGPVFPPTIAGLDVHGVRWLVEARNRGLARGLVAVAGYLGMDAIPGGCRDAQLGIFGAFCDRVAVLGEDPWYGGTAVAPDAPGFHLHPQFPVGVRMPSQAAFVAVSPSTATPPVILLGRFNDDRAATCVPGGRHCGQEFVVEQVAWVAGDRYAASVTVDPAAGATGMTPAGLRRASAAAASRPGGIGEVLLTVLATPGTLARIDPAMASSAAELPGDDPVWVVRAMHAPGDGSRIDWFLVALDGSRTLAAGAIETSPFPPFGTTARS